MEIEPIPLTQSSIADFYRLKKTKKKSVSCRRFWIEINPNRLLVFLDESSQNGESEGSFLANVIEQWTSTKINVCKKNLEGTHPHS